MGVRGISRERKSNKISKATTAVDFENFVQIEPTDFEKIRDEVFPIDPSGLEMT